MQIVRVSSKGQIVIPKAFRDAHHITAGTRLVVSAVGDELRLAPAPAASAASLDRVAGCLHRPGAKRRSETGEKQAIGELLLRRDEATKR